MFFNLVKGKEIKKGNAHHGPQVYSFAVACTINIFFDVFITKWLNTLFVICLKKKTPQ
jgi:hypothetical protein